MKGMKITAGPFANLAPNAAKHAGSASEPGEAVWIRLINPQKKRIHDTTINHKGGVELICKSQHFIMHINLQLCSND
jgi:hypothetical protein